MCLSGACSPSDQSIIGVNGVALIIGSQVVGRFTDILSERLLTAPLVGIAGEYTAISMGVVILASLMAFLSYYGLVGRASTRVQDTK